MIGTIDVKIQAHNPNFPLEPVFTFINSAQSFRIRNVPKRIGRWEINKVFVNVTYPDTTVISKECVLNGGVWVGTIEGCSISGKTLNGFVVTASGIDENELPISNYVLGVGDVFVQDLDGSISPDVNVARMYFYSTAPVSPKKGEATFIEDVLNIYDGTQWKPALEVDLTNYYDKEEIDDIIENVNESIPTKTSDLSNDSNFITTEEVKPFYEYDSSTGTLKPTEMASYAVTLVGAYKSNYKADKYAEIQPLVEFDPVELTPKFTLRGNYLGYYPWKLSKFFDQTYSPELELFWWYGIIYRVRSGRFIQYYTGFMWRTKGIGFAIPCDINGIPDGRLFEITLVEETSPYRIGFDLNTQIHTITGNENWSAILTIDEQENQITCTRSIVQRVKENRQTFPTLEDIPTKTSDLTNDSGFITTADVPTPSYIEDTNGNKIEANLNCKVKDLTLPWTVVDGVDTYTLNYNEQSEKWVYEETQTKKIELTYTTENNLWELSFYVWNNGEWQYDKGGTTTQEIDTTSLTILDWTLSRSILADDKLVTQTSGIGKLVSDVNNKYSTRVIVDEYDNVFLQKYSTGWYVSKINVQTEGTWVETNDYYAVILNARIDTEKNRLYFDIRFQDKNRNYPVYALNNVSSQYYSLGEFVYGFSTRYTWPDTISFNLTITNAETPVWCNITRLVPDSANNSGLLDTQITPNGQFITPTQIKPYTIYPGYAYSAVSAIWLYGRSNGKPNGNIFITIDGSHDNKLFYRNSNYYPWMLSMLDGVTFDTPLEMKFGYVDSQPYKKANKTRYFSINSYCWLVVVDVDASNQKIYFIKATENANGTIVPDTNFYILGTAHPITFSTNFLSIETIEGLNGITCTRQSSGTYIIEEKYFAYENDIPTKTSDLTNDSGFITSADIITKRDLSDMTVKGVPQNTNSQSWFTIKYGTTTENAYYYDEGRWESGVTTSVLATSANIYTLQKNLTNIGEFTLNNNAEATITYEDVTYSITGYVGEIVTSNQLNSQIAALEARISALENNT